ncbi:MAG: DNRLRE domain-containing protein [Anaerolineae bacterium]
MGNKHTQAVKPLRHGLLLISLLTIFLLTVAFITPSSGKTQAADRLGVNAKFFEGDRISLTSSAVFWFGKLDTTLNHQDVRIGYNPDGIQIYVNTFDYELFYDKTPDANDFQNWDSVDIHIRPQGSSTSYLFKSQVSNSASDSFEPESDYRLFYRNTGSGYVLANNNSFQTKTVWFGQSLNAESANPGNGDRGWYTQINIPFSTFGLSEAPAKGTVWEMAIVANDRDDAAGSVINAQQWPESANLNNSTSWGELRFSKVEESIPSANQSGSLTLRDGVNGVSVPDSHVGGGTNCGVEHDPDFFNGWPTNTFPGVMQVNIQNQMNVEDWPCFSKYFISFPMDQIPAGKVILSAKLTMYHFGNAGGGEFDPAGGSTLQVMTVDSGWNEATLNWRNSPSVVEHVAEKWVEPINNENNFADPAIPVDWDIQSAVADAYEANETLNLAIYAADWSLHSGKYFYSSDARDDYNRPILEITYGDAGTPGPTPIPSPTPLPTATPTPFIPTDFFFLPLTIR